jgi:ELWxxDGT repeat protein
MVSNCLLTSVKCVPVCCAMLFFSQETFSQAQLLKDINRTEELEYNEIREFTNMGPLTYFVSNGNELWKTDGTSAGTIRVRTFKSMRSLVASGSLLYFAADDGKNGVELWKTDGTGPGTGMVRNIGPAAASGDPLHLVDVNGTLYFAAHNGVNGREVWKTNGTYSGTVMVKDIMTGRGGSAPNRLTNVNGTVYFQANDNVHGYELWKTNGTSAGTVMVKDIRTGSKVGSFPELLTNVNGVLYFVAADNTTGRELWKSNGTSAGTVRVRDIIPGSGSPAIDNSTNVNGTLFFSANDGVNGKELWKSNGTSAGTVMVKDIKPGGAGADGASPMGNFEAINGRLYFVASNDTYYGSMQIHVSDGTAAGTKAIRYLTSIFAPVRPNLTYYKGSLFFTDQAYDDYESEIAGLFKMNLDGTNQTIVKKLEHYYYAQDFTPDMIAGSTYLLLSGRLSPTGGQELLRSDGTTAGTVSVKDTYVATNSSQPRNLVTVGNVAYFTAWQGVSGRDEPAGPMGLFRTDGTPGGTLLLKSHYLINYATKAGNKLYYAGMDTYSSKRTLYKVDGPGSAPVALRTGMGEIYNLANVNGSLYFIEDGTKLWKSDGTPSGTMLLRTFYHVYSISDYNGTAMIFTHNASALELWKSNGTSSGTVKIKELSLSGGRYYPMGPKGVARNLFFFAADNGTHGYEMWRSNGTATGTFMISDLRTGDATVPIEIDIEDAAVMNDSLYFSAKDNTGTWALFRTDGSTVGTTKLRNMNGPGKLFVQLDDKLMIFVERPDVISDLWVSDGTMSGTQNIKTLGTRIMEIDPAVVNNVMYFNTSNNTWGDYQNIEANEALWRSDGTACGTFYFNIGAYRPHPMEALGTKLIFSGYTVKTGAEPYAYNTMLAPSNPCGTATDSRIASTSDAQLSTSGEDIFTFAPNPFINDLRLQINGAETETAQVIVYTLSGSAVELLENVETNREYTIGEHWPVGMYIIRVNIGRKTQAEKILKK